jgi:prepilin-type N-terminal cleavage/methylation domain-containing protein
MIKLLNKNKGFTLAEVLVYIAIFSLIMVLLGSFIFWLSSANMKTASIRETLENCRRAIDIMSYEIKEANSIYTPTTTSDQLSLETSKYLPEGEDVSDETNTSFIDFYICDGHLCMKKESQDPITITSDNVNIDNLIFTRVLTGASSSVKISLSVSYKNPNNRPEYNNQVVLNSSVSLRSY